MRRCAGCPKPNVRKVLATVFLAAHIAGAAAVPGQITYQGTLRDNGVPVTGPKTMIFRITDQAGTAVYWSSGQTMVNVDRGYFATALSPTGVNWQNITPYIEVSVDGVLLMPREPLTSTLYSFMSQSVVDGAITLSKLDSSAQSWLVPTGAIMLFAGPCPAGWSRFSSLDGLFPLGSSSYGQTGGSASHTHSISSDGNHNHGGRTQISTPNNRSGSGSGSPTTAAHDHILNSDGSHSHGGATGSASALPPYLSVVFCQKQ